MPVAKIPNGASTSLLSLPDRACMPLTFVFKQTQYAADTYLNQLYSSGGSTIYWHGNLKVFYQLSLGTRFKSFHLFQKVFFYQLLFSFDLDAIRIFQGYEPLFYVLFLVKAIIAEIVFQLKTKSSSMR